jgi:hypothetical protein
MTLKKRSKYINKGLVENRTRYLQIGNYERKPRHLQYTIPFSFLFLHFTLGFICLVLHCKSIRHNFLTNFYCPPPSLSLQYYSLAFSVALKTFENQNFFLLLDFYLENYCIHFLLFNIWSK